MKILKKDKNKNSAQSVVQCLVLVNNMHHFIHFNTLGHYTHA